jgi:CheY-like chemotaxis protein
MEAEDGEEAVTVFKENRNRVDIIIMDAVMPKKNGWEALRRSRRYIGMRKSSL